jgi:hypothetical protein
MLSQSDGMYRQLGSHSKQIINVYNKMLSQTGGIYRQFKSLSGSSTSAMAFRSYSRELHFELE